MIAQGSILFAVSITVVLAGSVNVYATPMLSERPSQQATTPSPYAATLTRAYEALAALKLDEARKLFQEATKLDPKAYMPWLGLADVALQSKDAKGAEGALRMAVEIAPDRPEPVIATARLRFSRESFDEAEALLVKASKMDAKSATPLVDLGDLYVSVRRDPDRAVNYYNQAIQIDPRHAGAHYALGMITRSRDALSAIPILEKAQEFAGPGNALPSLALGSVFGQLRRWGEAQIAYTRAIDIQPGLAMAYVGRATAYSASGARTKALADLRKAEELDPRNPEVPFRLGLIYQEQGATKEAYAAYERAIRLDAKYVPAYNNLAWLAATRRERLDDALGWIQKARALSPKAVLLYDTQGWVLRSRGDSEGAIKVLAAGIALSPNEVLHYHMGVVLMEVGRNLEARNHLAQALRIKPDFDEAQDAKMRLRTLEMSTSTQGNRVSPTDTKASKEAR